jgi:hypothetical protein
MRLLRSTGLWGSDDGPYYQSPVDLRDHLVFMEADVGALR